MFSSSSIGRVTSVSTSAGETPGYIVLIAIIGIVISGADSFGILRYERNPATDTIRKSTTTLV